MYGQKLGVPNSTTGALRASVARRSGVATP
jgi:hypothetical protein